MRTAVGTGNWLRMESSIFGIFIFGATGGTHREGTHGRVDPIVGQIKNDAETWSAMGAVDKRIPEAAIRRVVQFSQACRTDRDIGQDERHLFSGPVARADLELSVANGIEDS